MLDGLWFLAGTLSTQMGKCHLHYYEPLSVKPVASGQEAGVAKEELQQPENLVEAAARLVCNQGGKNLKSLMGQLFFLFFFF